jgi:lipoate synthase
MVLETAESQAPCGISYGSLQNVKRENLQDGGYTSGLKVIETIPASREKICRPNMICRSPVK